MTSEDNPLCIFCNARHTILGILRPSESASTALSGIQPEPGSRLEVIPFNEATRRADAVLITDPIEISAATFDDMLNILPPVRWTNHGSSECFKISERISGNVTATYVRIADRHFTFNDLITLPHDKCCEKVMASLAFQQPSPVPANDR